MPGRKSKKRMRTFERTSRAPRVIACAGFYLIAALFAYALFAGSGSPFAGVKHVLCGLGGVLAFLIPCALAADCHADSVLAPLESASHGFAARCLH